MPDRFRQNKFSSYLIALPLSFLLLAGCPENNPESTVEVGLNIGQRAPSIKSVTPSGDSLSLRTLKGKLVLIDFWASWCKPCRYENINLVETYRFYKNKKFSRGMGFEIFSYSLDQKKGSWVYAMNVDSLDWPSHVSDLNGWKSTAINEYKIRQIPHSVLIDENGIIIAKNLRGILLRNKLEELHIK